MWLRWSRIYFEWLVVLCLVPGNLLLDPFSSGFAVGASFIASVLWNSKDAVICQFRECCAEPYVRTNLIGLRDNLEKHVFGQHIVIDTVVKSLKSHLLKKEPKKALALSFHGMTGSGKNYVSEFIAESLYEKGLKSKYVHTFISTTHFPLPSHADQYKIDLQTWVKGNVSLCGRSLFIFDEIDKLAPGVIDGIKPYLDYHQHIDGVDYRKSIFVFISNTGGKDIAKVAHKHWIDGKQREELTINDLENTINMAAFNEQGGLQKTDLIVKELIDAAVPFLPMEKKHVKMCIRQALEDSVEKLRLEQEKRKPEDRIEVKTFTEEDVNRLADQKNYWPDDYKIFSTSGCKKVEAIVDRFLEDDL